MKYTLAIATFLFPAVGLAQTSPKCAARDTVIEQLAARYGESRHGIGLAANNAVMELFASDETGTWTILITLPNGLTCLVASGENYETVPAAPQGDPT